MNLPARLILLFVLSTLAAAATTKSAAQEKLNTPTPEELREMSRPGPEHTLLSEFSGNWMLEVASGRSGKAATSSGGGHSYMTLENRFLWLGYQARGPAGNYKGSFTIGFDRRHGRFNLIAMDTDGTYFVTSNGKMDPETKNARLHGKDDDPYMKSLGLDKEFINEIDFSNPDHLTISVYYIDTRTPEKKEMKAIEYNFKRREEKSQEGASDDKPSASDEQDEREE